MKQDILTIDPERMGIVNRIAAGSRYRGELISEGGILVQGHFEGQLTVRGPLVVWQGARLSGQIQLLGDLYLFGVLGAEHEQQTSELVCMGTAYLASTALSYAALSAQRIQMYDGAQLEGPFRTLPADVQLPRLDND